jgi:hypothetical protein
LWLLNRDKNRLEILSYRDVEVILNGNGNGNEIKERN